MAHAVRLSMLCGSLFASLCGCEAFVGEYRADLPSPSSATDTVKLCEVERAAFVLDLDLAGAATAANLEGYYQAQNQNLIARLRQLASELDGSMKSTVTYVLGASGVGKSFVFRNVFEGLASETHCSVDIPDLFSAPQELGFGVGAAPDLATLDGSLVLSQLPAISDLAGFDLDQLLDDGGCLQTGKLPRLVLIDGIDELQDDSSETLLRAIDNYVLEGPGAEALVHFVVVGRPEAFSEWLTDPKRTERNQSILQSFVLTPPEYRTAGDLDFRVRAYLEFTGELAAQEQTGQLEKSVETFTNAVAGHPFLTYSIGNLAVGNVVVAQTITQAATTEAELKAGLFDDMLLRNAETHQRPGKDSPYDAAYRRALEEIAVRFAVVDERGEFAVRAEDTVPFVGSAGEALGELRVRNVLNRSGVAFLTSTNTATSRYRFEPFWLHAHLIERRNQRVDTARSYRGCE